MINRIIIMFIPSGISLGLVGAYLISQGISPFATIGVLAVAAFFMAVIMVNIALDTFEDDYEDGDKK